MKQFSNHNCMNGGGRMKKLFVAFLLWQLLIPAYTYANRVYFEKSYKTTTYDEFARPLGLTYDIIVRITGLEAITANHTHYFDLEITSPLYDLDPKSGKTVPSFVSTFVAMIVPDDIVEVPKYPEQEGNLTGYLSANRGWARLDPLPEESAKALRIFAEGLELGIKAIIGYVKIIGPFLSGANQVFDAILNINEIIIDDSGSQEFLNFENKYDLINIKVNPANEAVSARKFRFPVIFHRTNTVLSFILTTTYALTNDPRTGSSWPSPAGSLGPLSIAIRLGDLNPPINLGIVQ